MDKNILIVDDDPNIREILDINLKNSGFAVRTVENGRAALSELEKKIPDLAVLDVMMPEIDGWELCKLIKDDKRYQGVKILMLTAKGHERDRMIGKEILKADEYVIKPFDIDALIETIKKMLAD